MNYLMVMRMLGIVGLIMAAAMVPSLLFTVVEEAVVSPLCFLSPILFCLVLGYAGMRHKIEIDQKRLSIRGGVAFLGIGWLLFSVISAIPYYASGMFTLPKALFESASALTTTGVSAMEDGSMYPASLVLWHDISQWLGGIGAILIFAVLLPQLGTSAANLFSAEVQGNSAERTMPRSREAVTLLFRLYAVTTVVQAGILMLLGQPFKMALRLSAATISTSGYIYSKAYLAQCDSLLLELVLILFMLIGSGNFILYYRLTQKRFRLFEKDTERRWYTGFLLLFTVLVTFNLWKNDYYTVTESLRYGLFTVVSMMSTTGLGTEDFSQWPAFSRLLLFYGAIIGGCSASTAGGMKVSRVVVLLKVCWQEIKRTLHPNMVSVITMSGKVVPTAAIVGVGRYFFLYFIVFMLLTMVYSLTGSGMLESMATVVVFLSNVGSAYGIMGEATSFAGLTGFGYIVLYVTMIMGRIELFALIMFFHPDFWNRKRSW